MDLKTITIVVIFLLISSYGEKVKEEDLNMYAFSNEGNIWMASSYINVRFEIDGRHLKGILDFAKKMKATLDNIPYVKKALEMKDQLKVETVTNIGGRGMFLNFFDMVIDCNIFL